MKKSLVLALLSILLIFNSKLKAQTDFPIGTGTTGNTTTTYPCPLQDYYEGSRMQFLYRASELTAAGMVAGPITALKYNVLDTTNTSGRPLLIEAMQISIGGTADTTLDVTTWEPTTTTVFGPVDYKVTLGLNVFAFSTPYMWNGTDNIVIEVCNGDPNNSAYISYSVNPKIPWTANLTFNGTHTYRADNLGNLCGTTTTTPTTPNTTRPNIIFDTSACQPPSGITFSNITTTGAMANWTASTSNPSQYIWEVRSSGAPGSGTVGLVTSGNSTTTDATITGLTPATTYYMYVRSNCGSLSSWSGAGIFVTNCVSINAFTENFDSVGLPNLPVCWSKILRGSTIGAANIVTGTGNAYSTPNAVVMTNTNAGATDDIILVSPNLGTLALGTYELTFYAKNSTATQDLEIGTLDDNTANGIFTVLQTVDITTAYQKYIVSFANYTGTDHYIGIRRLSTSTYTTVYLDNITWTPAPSCVEPNTLMQSNLTSSGVQIDWTAPASSTPASYELYYSTNSTAPTSATTPTVTGITGTSTTLSGLMSATKYYYYVRSNCGSGGTSMWTGVDSFLTNCTAVTSFSENFDAVTTPALPICWAKVGTTGTVNTQTGSPASAPNTMYIYGTSATNQAIVALPPVSNAGAGTHRLVLDARGNFTAGALLEVGYLTNPTDPTTFVMVDTFTTHSLNYERYAFELGTAPGTAEVLAIRHTGAPSYSVLIDNIKWEAIPTCLEPTGTIASNITTTSAQLDWTAPASGTPASYEVYYSTSSTAPADTATAMITGIASTTTNLSNLNPSSTYYVWVRSNCGGSGKSTWSVAYSFNTACAVITPPTVAPQTFNNGVIPPQCWSVAKGMIGSPTTITPATTNNWVPDAYANIGTVNNSAKINIYGTTRQDWLMTPTIDLGTGNYQLEFDLAFTQYAATTAATLGPDDKFYVVISTDNGVTWDSTNALMKWNENTPISNTGEHVVIPLTGYTGQVMIGFYGESTVSNVDNDLFVDNVELKPFNVVPVSLASFTGERKGSVNQLNWRTVTEMNSKGFEVERSVDGIHFSAIGFKASTAVDGNSNAAIDYRFTDEQPVAGTNYYRLKLVNKDNKFVYSRVVAVKGKVPGIVLSSLYPNPAKAELNITVSSPVNEELSIMVTDLSGKVVLSRTASVYNGDNQMKINVSRLAAGTYIVKAICSNGCESALRRFIKE